jgi:hypothetical protein
LEKKNDPFVKGTLIYTKDFLFIALVVSKSGMRGE